MWREIGKLFRAGIVSWGATARMVVCVAIFTASAVMILWAQSNI